MWWCWPVPSCWIFWFHHRTPPPIDSGQRVIVPPLLLCQRPLMIPRHLIMTRPFLIPIIHLPCRHIYRRSIHGKIRRDLDLLFCLLLLPCESPPKLLCLEILDEPFRFFGHCLCRDNSVSNQVQLRDHVFLF